MDRVRLTSNGQFEFEQSNDESVETSTDTEVKSTTETETQSVFVWGEDSVQVFDYQVEKEDVVIGLLLLNIGLQAGDFFND